MLFAINMLMHAPAVALALLLLLPYWVTLEGLSPDLEMHVLEVLSYPTFRV
jgi:hypothetical protein